MVAVVKARHWARVTAGRVLAVPHPDGVAEVGDQRLRGWAAVSFFDDSPLRITRTMSTEQAAYYRRLLAAHSGKPPTGACPICRVARCPDWTAAYDALAAAGEPMGDRGEQR